MAASFQDLSNWFDRGIADGQGFMLIVCDTFDYGDYPVYTATADEARDRRESPGDMQRVMEVYDLHADKRDQMSQHRCWAV